MNDPFTPHNHGELVNALLELATASSRILDEFTRAADVPDREAATDHLHEAFHVLLAPMSMLLGPRDLKAATAVIEAAANVLVDRFDYAPCEVVPAPRRDPRETHRRLRSRVRARRGART